MFVRPCRTSITLLKPWSPPDDLLHPLVTELLAEWVREHRPRAPLVEIVGEQWDPRSHELRDVLDRNGIPFAFYAQDSDAGQRLLAATALEDTSLPVVVSHTGAVLLRPSNAQIAEALGVRTSPDIGDYDVAIVGAGPAGLGSAVYAASEGLRTIVIEAEAVGGQAGASSLIRNYLGFPRGLSGTDLATRAYQQAFLFGAEFVFTRRAMSLRAAAGRRIIALSDGSHVRARAVVLATGVSYRRLGIAAIDDGDEHPWCVRRRRRPASISETGSVGRR